MRDSKRSVLRYYKLVAKGGRWNAFENSLKKNRCWGRGGYVLVGFIGAWLRALSPAVALHVARTLQEGVLQELLIQSAALFVCGSCVSPMKRWEETWKCFFKIQWMKKARQCFCHRSRAEFSGWVQMEADDDLKAAAHWVCGLIFFPCCFFRGLAGGTAGGGDSPFGC